MMIVACATDDGKNFISRYFGDAKQYNIYEMKNYKKTTESLKRIERIHILILRAI